tara:strand:- start:36320 stop:36421 length:102 start_codon:yes stop_codon:yes gene_type:complete
MDKPKIKVILGDKVDLLPFSKELVAKKIFKLDE